MSEESICRDSVWCICGAEKTLGMAVCWHCFKDRTDIPPLKDFGGSLQEWMILAADAAGGEGE